MKRLRKCAPVMMAALITAMVVVACSRPETSAISSEPLAAAQRAGQPSSASAGEEVVRTIRADQSVEERLTDFAMQLPSRLVEAPAFELVDMAGIPHSLSEYRGKVVLLNFWATWCVPCKTEMPSMERLHQTLGDQGLALVGINLRESRETISAFLTNEVKATFDILLDSDGEVSRAYGANALPMNYVINDQGRIVARAIGAREWDSTEALQIFEALLEDVSWAEPTGTTAGGRPVPVHFALG